MYRLNLPARGFSATQGLTLDSLLATPTKDAFLEVAGPEPYAVSVPPPRLRLRIRGLVLKLIDQNNLCSWHLEVSRQQLRSIAGARPGRADVLIGSHLSGRPRTIALLAAERTLKPVPGYEPLFDPEHQITLPRFGNVGRCTKVLLY